MTISPSAQAISVGPVPIPGNLIPPLDPNALPIVATHPNLGTVSIALPISIYSINQAKSGQDASDPLTNAIQSQQQLQDNQQFWSYGGDAPALNAPYQFFKDSQGLHIDVQAPSDGTWAGYYAVTPNTNAKLYHAVITTPVRTISTPNDFYENGLYVQTSQPFVNYVSCFSSTGVDGTVWAVGSVTGDANQATQFQLLWADTSMNQPLTRDCTIITNGSNYLKVYLDGAMVYSSNTLNLQMPAPFNAYLEPQSSYAGAMLDGIYKDYYSATGETVKVTDNPTLAATVKLVDPTGKVLANEPVDSSGTSTLNVGQFHFPLVAYIKIYDSLGIQLASTSSPVNLFGGDVYDVKSSLSIGPIGLSVNPTTPTVSSSTISHPDTSLVSDIAYTYGTSTINSASANSLPDPISSATGTVAKSTGITVYAHRIPADYWDPCFATECSAGTGPGASMYFELADAAGDVVDAGFADENGYTFSGLDPTETYYVYPTNCYSCHGSTHDVLFEYWGNGSTDVPRAAKIGANLNAWFSCDNGCSGD